MYLFLGFSLVVPLITLLPVIDVGSAWVVFRRNHANLDSFSLMRISVFQSYVRRDIHVASNVTQEKKGEFRSEMASKSE